MKNIRTILSYTSHLRGYFLVIAALSVVSTLVGLATPFIIKLATDWIVDIVSGKTVFNTMPLVWLLGAQVVVMLVGTAATDIGGWYGDTMAIKTRRQLSKLYYQHLLALPQHYYDREITGTIINRLSRAITDITQFLQFFSNNLLQMLLTMIITIVILCWYSWPLALLFMLLIPANLYLTAKTSGKWQRLEKAKNKQFDQASGRFAEVIGNIRLAKSFNTEKRELKVFDARLDEMIGLTKEQSFHWHGMNALRSIVFGCIFAAIYGILFYQTATRQLSVGEMVLLLSLITQVSFPLRNLSFFVDTYQRAVANSKDFIAAMNEKPEPKEPNAKKLEISRGAIAYDDVSFSYEKGTEVLKNISFSLEPGEKLALVGESGGGKTTISNLLLRLYAPDKGVITIDGTDIGKVDKESVRKQVAVVFQDPALLSGTIRENIAYGAPRASDKAIEEAAKAANAYEFIKKLPHGFESEIGERGVKLSGGQKQRIAIARALLKDAPILILDEATSSLDSRSEGLVQTALERLMKGRTVLIIAHRLSTIAHVDKIVTLKNGTIDEVGTPGKLAATNGIYAQLLELQMGATEAAKKQLAAYEITN